MKIINREIGYSIRTLCYMFAEKDDLVTAGHLAKYFNISRPFLRKILQKLNHAGILDSYKGKKGGFKIALPADRVFLIDLINIFQGPIQLSGCYNRNKECPLMKNCPIQKELEKLGRKLVNDLSKISLKSIIDEQNDELNQEKQ